MVTGTAESPHLDAQVGGREMHAGNGAGLLKSQRVSTVCTSDNTTPLKPSQTVLSTGDAVVKHMSPWEPFSSIPLWWL